MSEQEPQLPESLRKALKKSPTFQPPESFYTKIIEKIEGEQRRLGRFAWLWAPPMRLVATMGIVMVSYYVYKDESPWGPKKAEIVYDQVSSDSRAPAMAQAPMSKDEPTPALIGGKVVVKQKEQNAFVGKENLREKDSERKFPWQSTLQAQQSPRQIVAQKIATQPSAAPAANSIALDETNGSPAAAKTSGLKKAAFADNRGIGYGRRYDNVEAATWSGPTSQITTFRTKLITREEEWQSLWQMHTGDLQGTPRIDFSHNMVVGIFAGSRPDLTAVEIDRIEQTADTEYIYYREIPLPVTAGIAAPEQRPFVLRVIPKTSRHIEFKKL
jgi:hypothetical protein